MEAPVRWLGQFNSQALRESGRALRLSPGCDHLHALKRYAARNCARGVLILHGAQRPRTASLLEHEVAERFQGAFAHDTLATHAKQTVPPTDSLERHIENFN